MTFFSIHWTAALPFSGCRQVRFPSALYTAHSLLSRRPERKAYIHALWARAAKLHWELLGSLINFSRFSVSSLGVPNSRSGSVLELHYRSALSHIWLWFTITRWFQRVRSRVFVCVMRRSNKYPVLNGTPWIAYGAKISRIDGVVKIAKIERKVQAPR